MEKEKRTVLRKNKESLIELIKKRKLIFGNLSSVYLPCGKPGCKCTRGFLHGPMWRITWKEKDKRSAILYIQRNRLEQAKRGISDYKKARKLLKEIGLLNLSLFHKEEKKRKDNGKELSI